MRFLVVASLLLLGGLAFGGGTAEARVIIKERTKHYNVSGNIGARIYKSMLRRGPRVKGLRHVLALTEVKWKVGKPEIKIRGRHCTVRDVDIKVTITYTFPRWTGRKKASKKMRALWDRYYAALKKHENRHGKIYKQLTYAYEKEIKRARGRVSRECDDFGKKAMKRLDRLRQSYDAKQAAFDRREMRRTSRITKLEQALVAGN